MNSPELLFQSLSAMILSGKGTQTITDSSACGGMSASAQAAWLNATASGVGSPAVVTAGKDIFEGVVGVTSAASWGGDDVVGSGISSIGAKAAESSFVEGLTVFAGGSTDAITAATVGNDHSARDGWYTGGFINAIRSTLIQEGVTELQIYAMAKYASAARTNDAAQHDLNAGILMLKLDGVYNEIRPNDRVIFEYEALKTALWIDATLVVEATVATLDNVEVSVPVTRINLRLPWLLAALINISEVVSAKIRIWFDPRRVGTLERIPTKTVTKNHILHTPRPITLPPKTHLPTADTDILIQDAEGTTLRAKGGGQVLSNTPHILITEVLDDDFSGELVKPITFLWGLTKVTRGQTVHREVIGSGDTTQTWQSFRLAKSPLTYVADPFSPGGRRPEIEVFVNGIKWRRAQSFYKATPTDEIYVIRHDADHQTFIQFGDGDLGKRLPTGTNNIVATYRFGVGGNVEANTITKLVRPIKGVKSVYNPLPATGGEDLPTEQEAREKAIQSTRVLGKLVSLVDFEVEAARYGGVIKAKAEWAWDSREDSAVVKVSIITADAGDPSAELRAYLMNMAEPDVRVQVHKATKELRELTIDVELDPDYLPEEVQAAVDARLFDELEGLLAPRNARIGGFLHRSEIYAAIHEIEGVLSVRGVLIFGIPMLRFLKAGEGGYLAFTYPEAG